MNPDYLLLLQRLAPECAVVFTAFAVLFADVRAWRHLAAGTRSRRCAAAMTLGLGLAAVLAVRGQADTAEFAGGTLVLSATSQHVKVALLALAVAAAWLCTEAEFTSHVGEFMALLGLAATGMMFLAGTDNLLMVFVSLELVSLSLYAMTAFDRRSAGGSEAALRYFLFGGMAAAFMLFGFSLLYGLTGSLHLPVIAGRLAVQAQDPLALVAVVLVLAGFGFKVAAAPFHPWAPDAYQGAPVPAAAFIASGSKVAGLVVLGRVLQAGLGPVAGSGAWGHLAAGWMPVVAVLAAASMVLGNAAALVQSDLRRLLAYSAVAHAGYALLAVLGGSTPALLYYAVTYAATAAGAFGVVAVLEARTGDTSVRGLAGLRHRSPLLAWTLTAFVLSLAGIPPLAGFYGKLEAFIAAAPLGGNLGGLWLVLLALGTSCVSLYYYLGVLRQVWVEPGDARDPVRAGLPVSTVLVLLAAAVVALGSAPDLLLRQLR